MLQKMHELKFSNNSILLDIIYYILPLTKTIVLKITAEGSSKATQTLSNILAMPMAISEIKHEFFLIIFTISNYNFNTSCLKRCKKAQNIELISWLFFDYIHGL